MIQARNRCTESSLLYYNYWYQAMRQIEDDDFICNEHEDKTLQHMIPYCSCGLVFLP